MSQSFDGSQNDLVLTLPDDIEVKDLKWISIWCRRFELTFGDFVFPDHSDGEDDVPRQDVVKPQKKPGTLQKYIILNTKLKMVHSVPRLMCQHFSIYFSSFFRTLQIKPRMHQTQRLSIYQKASYKSFV